ncbi:MAG: triose-phosphate isomerase [Candidatus Aminicenantes bacterium]|nr:triose-phosphate isomerase [Candidatus Aminicenantes bacterium]
MRRRTAPFIAGNWKMYKTLPEAAVLAGAVRDAAPGLKPAEIVILPPYTALAGLARLLAGTAVGLGAQNLHWEDQGAFTGEVSAPMLADAGCRYVVVGHSERRQLFGETDEAVNRKMRAALKGSLRPIFCFGETLEEREAGRTFEVVGRQLAAGLEGIGADQFDRIVLAYEPVWAIGTGRTATPEQAEEVHAFVRSRLSERAGNGPADYAIILYGGSVKPANAYSLFKEWDIDGFLVGGASLEAESFIRIAEEAVKAYKEVQ